LLFEASEYANTNLSPIKIVQLPETKANLAKKPKKLISSCWFDSLKSKKTSDM